MKVQSIDKPHFFLRYKQKCLYFSMWSITRYAYISNLIYIGSTLGVVLSCPALFSNFFLNFTTRVLFRFIKFYFVLLRFILFHCIPWHLRVVSPGRVPSTRRTGPYTRYRVNLEYFEFFAFPR